MPDGKSSNGQWRQRIDDWKETVLQIGAFLFFVAIVLMFLMDFFGAFSGL